MTLKIDNKRKYTILKVLISSVWLINGLICKILSLVPRHGQIVENIVGHIGSIDLTLIIGAAEIGMAIWVLTNYKPKLNSIVQILVVGTMNIIEFLLVPELLLWGRLNALFAVLFIGIIYYSEFVLRKSLPA